MSETLLWESCGQAGKETWSERVNVGGVAARGFNPSEWDCQSGIRNLESLHRHCDGLIT